MKGGWSPNNPLGVAPWKKAQLSTLIELYNGESGDLIETTREAVAKNTRPTRKAARTPPWCAWSAVATSFPD